MIQINGKEYKNAPLTFNNVCQMEDMGVSISDMKNKNLSLVRAYAALCMGADESKAGAEIEQHVIAGGKFGDLLASISKAFNEEAEKSDFFRTLGKKPEEETVDCPKEATKKRS